MNDNFRFFNFVFLFSGLFILFLDICFLLYWFLNFRLYNFNLLYLRSEFFLCFIIFLLVLYESFFFLLLCLFVLLFLVFIYLLLNIYSLLNDLLFLLRRRDLFRVSDYLFIICLYLNLFTFNFGVRTFYWFLSN